MFVSVVGSLRNSQIEIRRQTAITNNLFKLGIQNILQNEEPNEIHIKISKRNRLFMIHSFFKTY